MPNRRQEVVTVPFPLSQMEPGVQMLADVVRENVGFVTSLLLITLQLSETGLAVVAASGGTVIVQANDTLDLEDARINQVRLSGYGGSSGSGDSVRVKQGSTVLCTASLAASPARFAGSWSRVALAGGDQSFSLEVVGNASRTQTLHRVTLHCRTL
jgi:hypothetical protein